jgi:hypothetical protein
MKNIPGKMVGPWKRTQTGAIGNMTLKCSPRSFFNVINAAEYRIYILSKNIFLSSENGAVVSYLKKLT